MKTIDLPIWLVFWYIPGNESYEDNLYFFDYALGNSSLWG